jgi:uncharacterized C2H2 Zn-finger protein
MVGSGYRCGRCGTEYPDWESYLSHICTTHPTEDEDEHPLENTDEVIMKKEFNPSFRQKR